MASAGRRCTVVASAMLVAMAFGTAPGPAHPQDTAGAMAREWERRSEEAQRSLRIQAEQHLRMEQEAAHAQMPDTMYASTPDPSPPPHPFPLDARVTSAPERPPAPTRGVRKTGANVLRKTLRKLG